jgi:non-specific serine/threonine protein kinase
LTSSGSNETPLRLVCTLWPFWNRRNHFYEGRQWVERALVANADAPPSLRAPALVAATDLSYFQGDYVAVQAFAGQVLAFDDRDLNEERWTVAFALFALAIGAVDRRAFEEGATLAEKSLTLARETGAAWVGGLASIPIAHAAIERGDFERARLLIEAAVAVFRSSGDKWALAILLVNLCQVMVYRGEFDQAIAAAREGLMLSDETSDRRSLTWCLAGLGAAVAGQQQAERAARLWGAVEGISQSIGSPLPSPVRALQDLHLPSVRQSLGDEALAAAWAEGQAMTRDVAVAYALRDDEPG